MPDSAGTHFKLFLEITGVLSFGLLLSAQSSKAITCDGMGNLHIRYIQVWSNVCCHPHDVFLRDVPAYISETMLSHILYVLLECVFVVKVYGY